MLQANLQTLQDCLDPDTAHSLHGVLQSGGADLAALMQLEGLPQDTTAAAYVQQAVQQVCVAAVEWQSRSFAQVRSPIFVACCFVLSGMPSLDRCWVIARQVSTCGSISQCVDLIAVSQRAIWGCFWVQRLLSSCLLLSLLLP